MHESHTHRVDGVKILYECVVRCVYKDDTVSKKEGGFEPAAFWMTKPTYQPEPYFFSFYSFISPKSTSYTQCTLNQLLLFRLRNSQSLVFHLFHL